MAIDTLTKRASALNVSTKNLLPVPSGTIDAFDRLTLLDMYGGIAAGTPVVNEALRANHMVTITVGLGI